MDSDHSTSSLDDSLVTPECDERTVMKSSGLPTSFGGPSLTIRKKKPKFKKQLLQKQFKSKTNLFSRYFDGIQMDRESLMLVTPEKAAKHIAARCTGNPDTTFLLDPFCGVGGNVIQFALARPNLFILAMDISKDRIDMCRHNAKVYGVDQRIEFVQGDYMQLSNVCHFKPDVVFLSPPWGGKKYKNTAAFNLELMPIDGTKIFENTKRLTGNICYYLPRNIDEDNLLVDTEPYLELEEHFLQERQIAVCAYYGNLIKSDT
jgi:trimethylguanosine synthase